MDFTPSDENDCEKSERTTLLDRTKTGIDQLVDDGMRWSDCGENPENIYDVVNLRNPQRLGLFYDKFFESFTHKLVFVRVVLYPFFGVYLNIPGHLYAALTSILPMFWSLRLFFSFIVDSFTIFGRRRIPYMAIGYFYNRDNSIVKSFCLLTVWNCPFNRLFQLFQVFINLLGS